MVLFFSKKKPKSLTRKVYDTVTDIPVTKILFTLWDQLDKYMGANNTTAKYYLATKPSTSTVFSKVASAASKLPPPPAIIARTFGTYKWLVVKAFQSGSYYMPGVLSWVLYSSDNTPGI